VIRSSHGFSQTADDRIVWLMQLDNTIAFITGANRGIGRALLDTLLARGAKKIYAGARDPDVRYSDARVVPVRLDITDPDQVRAAAAAAGDVRLLINNAGVLASYSVLALEPAQLQRDLDVNVHGLLGMVRAFAPALTASGDAAIVNILSVVSLANMPPVGGYAASKAAAWSITQALRGELGPKGVRVHAVFPGPVDTEMTKHLDLPKTSAAEVARAIVDGIAADQLDIAPDPMSADALATFLRDPGQLARRFAG
jgi:NAD(P)-dependent dehydrogenase (short-subunit alcohol dehydrogenase family)